MQQAVSVLSPRCIHEKQSSSNMRTCLTQSGFACAVTSSDCSIHVSSIVCLNCFRNTKIEKASSMSKHIPYTERLTKFKGLAYLFFLSAIVPLYKSRSVRQKPVFHARNLIQKTLVPFKMTIHYFLDLYSFCYIIRTNIKNSNFLFYLGYWRF